MEYSLSENGIIIRSSDGAFIPADSGNADYMAYMEWTKEGNQASPYQPPSITLEVLKTQAQAELDKSDLTMHRVAEGVALGKTTWQAADVVSWVNYRIALRNLISSNSYSPLTLPIKPPYPAGT